MIKGGFILINKPEGVTSHKVVERLREITKIKKIGHAGTLDPLAQGLLILAIGREYTKKLSLFQKEDKEYIATLRLGAESDTFDRDGKIIFNEIKKIPEKEEVEKVLHSFLGEIEQVPPVFSAKKFKGKPLYWFSRRGILIKPKSQKVKIEEISLLDYNFPRLTINIKCSAGTYIRSLAHDIGQKLGCGAFVEKLVRTRIGKYSLEKALKLEEATKENLEKFIFQINE
jgi:tRNA pseudouridine55 synthase